MEPRYEVDGAPANPDAVRMWHLAGAWHFTAAQVRDRRVRGLDLHLTRLLRATGELHWPPITADHIVVLMDRALGDVRDASLRVYVCAPEAGTDRTTLIVSVRDPGDTPPTPQRLRSVPYQRPVAHIKHSGGFAQGYYAGQVSRAGYDGALLTAPDGAISETSIANIGFFDGTGVVWPDAPQLAGITKQLLTRELPRRGVPVRSAPVSLADVARYRAAFVSNSRGIAAVSAVDDAPVPVDEVLMKTLAQAYDGARWDEIRPGTRADRVGLPGFHRPLPQDIRCP
jgi:branched-subunit amino acid aminotransferase/4-amino-4-deoxychorismate lyase